MSREKKRAVIIAIGAETGSIYLLCSMRNRVNSSNGQKIHSVQKRNAWLFFFVILFCQNFHFSDKDKKLFSFKGIGGGEVEVSSNCFASAAIKKNDHGRW